MLKVVSFGWCGKVCSEWYSIFKVVRYAKGMLKVGQYARGSMVCAKWYCKLKVVWYA
jgi:hypothetical protein